MLIDHSFTATLDNDSKYLNPEQPGIAVEIAVPNNFDLVIDEVNMKTEN